MDTDSALDEATCLQFETSKVKIYLTIGCLLHAVQTPDINGAYQLRKPVHKAQG
jgi:hypothetical protein